MTETLPATEAAPWPRALVELYDAERVQLLRAAYLVCGSTAMAEDAVHDALVRVSTRWDSAERPRSYLYVAVVNAARDASRHARRTQRLGRTRTHDENPAELSLQSMALRDALARLPERQRVAVVLRFFADWEDEEIAREIGVRIATVRSLVHRGVARLREEWKR